MDQRVVKLQATPLTTPKSTLEFKAMVHSLRSRRCLPPLLRDADSVPIGSRRTSKGWSQQHSDIACLPFVIFAQGNFV